MRYAPYQVQCAVYEGTHVFNETSWGAEEKYKLHHESIIQHEMGLSANVTDALNKFLEDARYDPLLSLYCMWTL